MANTTIHSASDLVARLFPEVDTDSAEVRFYSMQNKIAIAVVEYRYHHGLTQTQLAKQLGVTQAMVSKYESGEYNFSLKTAYELFDKLGMRFDCSISESPADGLPVNTQGNSYISSQALQDAIAEDVPDTIKSAV